MKIFPAQRFIIRQHSILQNVKIMKTFNKQKLHPIPFEKPLAYAVLKRSLSFVQGESSAASSSYVKQVVGALGAIIDSAYMDRESVSKIKSFMESEDGLTLKQPQANVKSYVSKSQSILDVIAGMQEKNAETLGKIRRVGIEMGKNLGMGVG